MAANLSSPCAWSCPPLDCYDATLVQAAIQLPADELSKFGFFSQAALPEAMTKPLRYRVLAAWQQYDCGQTVYLEDQMFV